jgi:hypothetical protein
MMMTALENIRRLEQYVVTGGTAIDSVLEMGITKLINREFNCMVELKNRLSKQISEFETRYSIGSKDFYTRYKNGKMGDDTDFIEWASTIEMLENINRKLYLLKPETNL